MKRRGLALLSAVVLLVSTLYVGMPKVQAASEGTMTITTTEYGLSLPGSGYKNDNGYMNLSYTTTVTDYQSNGQNFLDADFAEKYITFDGGMTYQDLVNGMVSFYVATNNILQLNWANRTEAFTPGWSFTIAKGALLPYVNTAGATGYMALDREYTIRFNEANTDNQHVVKIDNLQTATFSLGNLGIWGNGTQGAGAAIMFDGANTEVKNYHVTYTSFVKDEACKDYFQLGDLAFEDLEENGVKIRFILDDATRCIQIEEWGSLRESMTAGDQLIFKKGFPIFYKDSTGAQWRANLDATYVYECTGSNPDNTQVFYGVKLEDGDKYGLSTFTTANPSFSQTVSGVAEQSYNVGISDNTNTSETYVSPDVLTDKVAEEYIEVVSEAGEQLSKSGLIIRYIPTTNVLQFGFQEEAMKQLKAGSYIRLKKGMPVVYMDNGTLKSAILDETYVLNIVSNDGAALTLNFVLDGSYRIAIRNLSQAEEAGAYYYDVRFDGTLFADAKATFQGDFDNKSELLTNYVKVKGKTAKDLIDDGWYLRRYHLDGFQAMRFYCPTGKFTFKDGDTILLKKGFPIAYETKENKTKVLRLEQDYGYVYESASKKFIYNSSLGNQPEQPEVTKTDVYDFNGIDFSTRVLEGEGKDALIKANVATLLADTSSVPEGFTDSVYGGGTSHYASVPVDFYVPIDLSKVTAVKVRMYVPTYATSGNSEFRLLTNESTSSGVSWEKASYESLGGTFGAWSDVDITALLKSNATVKDENGYLGRFILAFRAKGEATCYFDSISITYTEDYRVMDGIDYEDPALSEAHWCDVDHATYTISDADVVTIDGETLKRGETYSKLGSHTLTYEYYGKTYTRSLYLYRLGDGTEDGNVNLKDYMRMLKYNQKLESGTVTELGKTALDMDGNKEVNTTDQTVLARYLMTDTGVLAVFPIDGSITALAGEKAAQLLDGYTPGKAETIKNGKDIYYRQPSILRWFDYDQADSYTVQVSLKADMTDAKTYTTKGTTLELQNLLADTDYYWIVSNGQKTTGVQRFHTEATVRALTIDGVSNTRDAGGWTTVDGGKIKQGMFYRGAKLENVTEGGKAQFAELGIKTDLDLRNSTETSLETSPLGANVNYVNYSGPYYWGEVTGINAPAYKDALVKEIQLFANAENYPIYVHCSLGRDRTGTICFLINALCGASEKDLYLDYEFSLLSVSGTADNQSAATMVLGNFKTMYEQVKAYAPNGTMAEATEAYMKSIGITQTEIDSIRSILVEK